MKGALLVVGVYMLGFVLSELLVVIRPGTKVSIGMNFWFATACGMIAAAFML